MGGELKGELSGPMGESERLGGIVIFVDSVLGLLRDNVVVVVGELAIH